MHPLLSRPGRLLIYVLLWVVLGLVLAAALKMYQPRPWADALAFALPLSIVYGFVCLSAWWVCRAHPLGSGNGMRSVGSQVGAALQASAMLVGAGTPWAVLLSNWFGMGVSRDGILRDVALLFVAGIPPYLVSAIAHYLFLAFEASHAAERRVLEAQVGAREAELRALRAQLNPHFLFNSLNSINSLVGADPEGARRMCEGLGDFLRKTLSLGAKDSVTLAEELALVDRYLAIEQVRFGERLNVERAIDPDTLNCKVPPLLLQPLVENSFKHGVSGRVEGGTIRIESRIQAGRLAIAIENPVDEDAPTRKGEGVGLENVKRRLSVLGDRDAQLDARRVGDHYRVQFSLPAERAPVAV
jgi:two-component system, LytTR family, sensor histidine kinase AlgZ